MIGRADRVYSNMYFILSICNLDLKSTFCNHFTLYRWKPVGSLKNIDDHKS